MTRGRHGCDAVLENGPAAPELRHRCASLHHGRGPTGPAEYKCVARPRVHHGELPSDPKIRLTEQAPYKRLPPAKAGVSATTRAVVSAAIGALRACGSWSRSKPSTSRVRGSMLRCHAGATVGRLHADACARRGQTAAPAPNCRGGHDRALAATCSAQPIASGRLAIGLQSTSIPQACAHWCRRVLSPCYRLRPSAS